MFRTTTQGWGRDFASLPPADSSEPLTPCGSLGQSQGAHSHGLFPSQGVSLSQGTSSLMGPQVLQMFGRSSTTQLKNEPSYCIREKCAPTSPSLLRHSTVGKNSVISQCLGIAWAVADIYDGRKAACRPDKTLLFQFLD